MLWNKPATRHAASLQEVTFDCMFLVLNLKIFLFCCGYWKLLVSLQPENQILMIARVFKLVLLDEAADFLRSLPEQARDKMAYNIRRIQKGERNAELFKKLEGTDIWEFRLLYNKIGYRLFAFWDTEDDTLVVATHGIVKKTWKTPKKEITKAESLRKLYFSSK